MCAGNRNDGIDPIYNIAPEELQWCYDSITYLGYINVTIPANTPWAVVASFPAPNNCGGEFRSRSPIPVQVYDITYGFYGAQRVAPKPQEGSRPRRSSARKARKPKKATLSKESVKPHKAEPVV